jgi:hypothetical protein
VFALLGRLRVLASRVRLGGFRFGAASFGDNRRRRASSWFLFSYGVHGVSPLSAASAAVITLITPVAGQSKRNLTLSYENVLGAIQDLSCTEACADNHVLAFFFVRVDLFITITM